MVDGKGPLRGAHPLAERVPEVVDRIVAALDPRRIVLSGSVARGDDGPDSDIDLPVVVDAFDDRRHETAVAALRATRGLPVAVDDTGHDRRIRSSTGNAPGRSARGKGRP